MLWRAHRHEFPALFRAVRPAGGNLDKITAGLAIYQALIEGGLFR